MGKKRRSLDERNFNSRIPEVGAELPHDETKICNLDRSPSPPVAQFRVTTDEVFGDKLPEDVRWHLEHRSVETSMYARHLGASHWMTLGAKFSDILYLIRTAYIVHYGDSIKTRRRATVAAYEHLENLHRVSRSKVRLLLNVYARFGDNIDAYEFLRLTDMQYLVGADISDDIVNAIIEQRKADPDVSTRTVRALIASLRQQKGFLAAETM